MDDEEMTDAVDPTEQVREEISQAREEIGQLRDLFQRRLLEDKSKNALIETVQEQSRAVQEVLRHRQVESLMKEALLAIDRLRTEPASGELVDSVVDEILEVFARRGLAEIDDSADFDPRVHEIVGTVAASAELPANSIVAVVRTGYVLGDRLLRPTQVTVAVRVDDVGA